MINPSCPPDGTRVTVYDDRAGTLSVLDIARGTISPLAEWAYSAAWSPDGERLAFSSGNWDGYVTSADGEGEAEPLFVRDAAEYPTSWSSDGRVLAVEQWTPSGSDIWIVPLEGEPSPFLSSKANERAATFAPGGQWVAYASDESGRWEVYVRPYPGPGKRRQISNGGGTEPQWSRDGKELFYRNGYRMLAVDVDTGADFTASEPRLLFEERYDLVAGIGRNYDVSPDGQRFLMVSDTSAGELQVVINWFKELKRRAPTN